jgi:hypothetical protein
MPETPENLSKIIRDMVEKQAKERGKSVDNAALEMISRIPAEYATQRSINVDLAKLEPMISDIMMVASDFSRQSIGQDELKAALTKAPCHYLWFC